jgi:phosphoglycerate dehydrogenase-like enzyme
MKITILIPKKEFTFDQQERLSALGKVVYVSNRNEIPFSALIKLCHGSQILGADPDVLGGFEKSSAGRMTKLLESLPKVRYVALSTSSVSWIDLDYCRKRNIVVSHVPNWNIEAVAEQTLGLFIGLSKGIFIADRRTQLGKYSLEMGFELKGKTLGIIGLGHIGKRVAQLSRAIDMKVIAWNRSPKKMKGLRLMSLDKVLVKSDAISINLANNSGTYGFFSQKRLDQIKTGAIIVNLASRNLVDEKAMSRALKKGKIASYAYEGEDLESGPLAKIETAVGFKGFAWYTRESMAREVKIWTDNIISMAHGKPINKVTVKPD